MYIIEKLIKIYSKLTTKKNEVNIPSDIDNYELEDILTCKHTFMPIDSTGNMLACSKCGYLITKERYKGLKQKNKN